MKLTATSPAGIVCLSLAFFTGGVLNAATYYVSPSGNDANPGTAAAPFRTVAKGVNVAAAGDTVILGNGTYGNEGHISDGTGGYYGYASPVSIYSAGTASAPITLMAANSGQAILDCGTTSTALGCDKYIVLYGGAAYWNFEGLVFTRGAFGGIGTDNGASHITIKGCQFAYIGNWYDTTQIGEDGIGFDINATNWWIEGNVFHDIGRTGGLSYDNHDHGIYAKGVNITVINNIFYNMSKGWSISTSNGSNGWLIANNTFVGPSSGGGQIMLWDTNSNFTIRNNIFYNPVSYAIETYTLSMSGCAVDHNLIFGAATVMDGSGCTIGTNLIGANPQFVNASAYDFQLQAGSPAIGAGVYISTVTEDFNGVTRPPGTTTDIGAYEYVSGGTVTSAISGVFSSSITTTSATVNWTTNVAATSYAQYGLSSYTNSTAESMSMVTIHSAALSNLTPSTLYHYRAASHDSLGNLILSGDFTFTTGAVVSATTFSVSASFPSVSVPLGASGKDTVTATLLTGASASASFSISGLPKNVSASFSSTSCSLSCSTTLTLSARTSARTGAYPLQVTATGAGLAISTAVTLNITSSNNSTTGGDITTGLAAQWLLNTMSGTTAYDGSGNGNNGTISKGYWWNSAFGPCVYFNGSASYTSVPESASLEFTNQMTISFWLDPNANTNTDPRVISKLYDWEVTLNGANRYPQLSAAGAYATLNYSLPLNTWHHIVFTFTTGVVTGYVDGVQVPMLQNTFTGTQTLAQWAYGLYLALDAGQANPLIGSMASVRLYNRALSSVDVAALYAAR